MAFYSLDGKALFDGLWLFSTTNRYLVNEKCRPRRVAGYLVIMNDY